MARLFGTDGVRGLANKDVTAELVLSLSVAAAHVLGEQGSFAGHRPRALVCRDGRASGELLGAAAAAGLASAGVDVLDLGVLPTPAVAYLTGVLEADLAAMLSASHNAMPDNGIKFFAAGGFKLEDAVEDAIEARLGEPWDRPTGDQVGRIIEFPEGREKYVDHLVEVLPNRLDGLHVALDCAHGATSAVAPQAFEAAGAEVSVMAAEPTGLNINDGVGSTHLDALQAFVLSTGADLGLAFDGDADRCLAVDHEGRVVDGDQIMAVLALAMKERGELANDTLVATVMSNLGLIKAMEAEGVTVLQTGVGDRYVLEEMRRGGHGLGGEQSGHVIMLDHGTTGDGTLTGLMLAAHVVKTGRTLADLASVVQPLPQVLVNVKGVDKDRVDSDEEVQRVAREVADELAGDGRVLLRKSGTEPLVRVMVEADTQERAEAAAHRIADVVRARLGL